MNILSPLISGLIAGLVVYWLVRSAQGQSVQPDGRHQVNYSLGLRGFTVLSVPLSAFVTYAALYASPSQKQLALIIAALFWAGTLYLAYECFLVRLSYDEDYIYHWTLWHGSRRFPWTDIQAVDYASLRQVYLVYMVTGQTISVSPLALGWQHFLEQASQHLDAQDTLQ